MKQHPTAIVESDASVAEDVEIGPYSVIHAGSRIGPGTVIESHVVIHGCTTIGSGNRFHQGCAIGDLPQDVSYRGSPTKVLIGNDNVFREYTTIHRGTESGCGVTTIGDNNYFMAHSHIAHDCTVGNNTIFAHSGSIAGHTVVEDFATVGPFSGVHQHCRVGAHGWIGAYTVVTKDVVPFSKTVGNRARIYGPNLLGLQRRGFSIEAIKNIRRAYRILFQSKLNTTQAIGKIEDEIRDSPEVDYIIRFIRSSKRGVIK